MNKVAKVNQVINEAALEILNDAEAINNIIIFDSILNKHYNRQDIIINNIIKKPVFKGLVMAKVKIFNVELYEED